MTWKSLEYNLFYNSANIFNSQTFGTNETCFIRKEHKCGKIICASKSCFIACPSNDNIEPLLALISEKLSKVGIEPIIAIKDKAYGQDIFCTKICGKIIESKFCIVILDDEIKNNTNISNPNVYYEYGLMTSLKKHIIPLQLDNQNLAFNIQSFDTIKYNNKNMSVELDRAIKEAIRITENPQLSKSPIKTDEKTLLRSLELNDFIEYEESFSLYTLISDTIFKCFKHESKEICIFLTKIDDKNEISTYLQDLDVVLHRSDKRYNSINQEIIDLQNNLKFVPENIRNLHNSGQVINTRLIQNSIERRESNIKSQINNLNIEKKYIENLYFGIIIHPSIDSKGLELKSNSIISKYDEKYNIVFSNNNEILINNILINFSN